MVFQEIYGKGPLVLGPFDPDLHIPWLVRLVMGMPWVTDETWFPDPEADLRARVYDKRALFFTGYDRDKLHGVLDFSKIRPGRDAWVHGYATGKDPWKAIHFLKLGCKWTFENLGLHKIFTAHCHLNQGVTAVCLRAGFKPEGILKDSMWFDGKPYDSLVLGLPRKEFCHG